MRGGQRRRKRRLARPLAAVTAGTLGMWLMTVVLPAEAATWSPTYNVSASGWMGQDSPTVSVDRQADALLVWAACDLNSMYCLHQVQFRIKPAIGSMGPIRTLSPLGTSSAWPQAASDDDGDSAVVWEQDSRVVGRRISASGGVGPLLPLSTTTALNPAVAVEPTGRALAVWTEIRGGSYYTVARYIGKDSSLGTVFTVGNGSGEHPQVAIDRYSTAVVVWTEGYARVVAKRIRPGYQSPLAVIAPAASGVGYGMPSVGVDRDGDVAVSFRRVRSGELPHVWARLWFRTGTFGPLLAISPSTDNVTFYSALAMDLEGDSMVVWSRRTSSTQTDVFGRRIYRTGALGAITRLGVGDRPSVALDDDGHGVAVWHSPGPPYQATKVYARTVAPTGVFSATTDLLSSDGRVVRADSSPGGSLTVTWQQRSYPYQIPARSGR